MEVIVQSQILKQAFVSLSQFNYFDIKAAD